MSGDWPPESDYLPGGQPPVPPGWEDPEEEFPDGADEQDAAALAQLSAVTAYLASVPAPVLPDAVGARIGAALAAEAAARAGGSLRSGSASAAIDPSTRVSDETAAALSPGTAGAAGSARTAGPADGAAAPDGGAKTLGPAPARARVRRRGVRSRSFLALCSVVACLALAGLGYGLSRGASPTSSGLSSAAAGSSAEQGNVEAGPAATEPAAASSASASAASSASASASASSASAASSSAAGPFAGTEPFTVTATGTKYLAATLAAQVRATLAAASGSVPGPSGTVSTPTAALKGCVVHLTHSLTPRLVDRATYQGDPAYIIASSSQVWVVGLGCTAANPELIVSVPLRG